MKKPMMIGALVLASLTAAPSIASAQSWRDHDRYERRDDRRDHRRWEREQRRDYNRWERDQRRDYRRWERDQRRDARAYHRWQRGSVIPYNYRSSWYVNDYRRYGWNAPPRGYGYYRTDSGDVVLAALATGVILSLIN